MKAGTRWLFVSFFLLASLFLLGISALADTTPDGFTYTVGTGGVTITGYTGTDVNLAVPGTIGGQDVVAIGDSAFSGTPALKSVSFPDSVLRLGNRAFENCISLESLSLGSKLKTVGSYAFSKCYALTSLSFPDSVSAIGSSVFNNDIALTTVELPESLITIESGMFLNCRELTSATIPENVKYILESAFSGCTKLSSIALPDGLISIGSNAFLNCSKLSSISLPNSLRNIYDRAFSGCTSLTEVSVPKDVTTISSYAFGDCTSLLNVSLPDNLTSIESGAFSGCNNLTTIKLPIWLPKISSSAFSDCEKLTNVSLPSLLTEIGVYAFKNCKALTEIDIPLGVTSIGPGAFSGCSALTSVSLPSAGLTTIGSSTFKGCANLASINIPNGIRSIDYWAFYGCANLASISLPDGLESIGDGAFEGCSALTSVSLRPGLTDIANRAFYGCAKLASINLPDGLASIGESAFMECSSLRSIDLPAGATIGYNAFAYTGLTSISIPDGTTTVGYGAFRLCGKLTSVKLPDSLRSIGDSAFYYTGLKNINMPRGVTDIGTYAFAYCESLTEIVLPDTVTSLGANAFYNCDYMKILLPKSISSIGDECFDGIDTDGSNYAKFYVYDGSYAQSYCAPKYPARTFTMRIRVAPGSLALGVDKWYKLGCSVTSYKGAGYTVEWASSDPAVASVDQSGLVTAVSPGTATITVTLDGDPDLTSACQVEVKRYASGLSLDRNEMTLYAGTSFTLTPIITPDNATEKSVTWESRDESVATVSDSGVVTALKAGKVTISASISGNGLNATSSCHVTVKQYVTGIILDKTDDTVYAGERLTLTATVTPNDASDKQVTWASSDEAVATVSKGVVTALKAGNATITATAADGGGANAACEIAVLTPVASVTVTTADARKWFKPGDELTLTADVQPADAHDSSLTWSSTNEKAARVDGGVVTAVGRGKATIKAAAHNGIAGTYTVAVEDRAADIELTILERTPEPNGVYRISVNVPLKIGADVEPAGIGHALTYKSSDSKVASVSATGEVKGLKNGAATITVTAKGTTVSKTLKIAVYTPAGKVSLPSEVLILKDGKKTLKAEVSPSTASNKAVTWKSDDDAVATVDSKTGLVTAKSLGTATVTATTTDGTDRSATCLVRVTDPATGIRITTETEKNDVDYKKTLQLTAMVDPATAYQTVTWKSSNTAYVQVSAAGKVYGRKVGKATITAISADGRKIGKSITIRVITPASGVSLPATEKIFVNRTKTLTPKVSPSNATIRTLTWKSENEEVATVDKGVVTAKALGTAVITATTHNGRTASCAITVTQPVEAITLKPEKDYRVVYKNETLQLSAEVFPADATDQTVTWQTSNKKIATVSNGLVTGKGAGKVKITATAKDGSKIYKSIPLLVASKEKAIKLSKAIAVLYLNGTDAQKTLKLTATASPKGSAYRGLEWKSDDEEVATVDPKTGVVTAVKDGEAVIRATTANEVTANCKVAVRTLPASFKLRTTEKALAFREGFDLRAEAEFDEDCTETALTWSSKDPKIATVDSKTGFVRANKSKSGTTYIKATPKKGKPVTCKIRVTKTGSKGIVAAPTIAEPVIELRLKGGDYATSDGRVADVDKDGKVTLKDDGTATLEAGGERITVKVSGGSPTDLTLYEGTALTLVSDAAIRWSVRDDRIASIEKDERLAALREGATTVCGEADGFVVEIRVVVKASEAAEAPDPLQTAEPEPDIGKPTPEPSSEPTPSGEPKPNEVPSAESDPSTGPEPTAEPGPTPNPPKTSASEAHPEPATTTANPGLEDGSEQ